MTLKEMRSWEVYAIRSTVSNDATRKADAKDAKFAEQWTDKRIYGWNNPVKRAKSTNQYDGRTYRDRNPTRRQREQAAKATR